MKYIIFETNQMPKSGKGNPGKSYAKSLSENLSKIGKVFYGVEDRGSWGWELGVSINSIRYTFVLSYLHDTRQFYVAYDSNLILSALFFFNKKRNIEELEKVLKEWASTQKSFKMHEFLGEKEFESQACNRREKYEES